MLRAREGEYVAFVCWECDGVMFFGIWASEFVYMLLAAWALGTFPPNKFLNINNVSNKIQNFK